jgi:hypothetical protein
MFLTRSQFQKPGNYVTAFRQPPLSAVTSRGGPADSAGLVKEGERRPVDIRYVVVFIQDFGCLLEK